MCFGTETIHMPPPPAVPEKTAEERGLQAEQLALTKENLDIVRQARAEEKAGRAAFETAIGQPYTEWMAGEAKRQSDLSTAIMNRYQKALKGELPVSPTLERSLAEQEDQLKEGMQRRLGVGWETSTPGIQALAEFKKRATELREAASRGEISQAEQLGFATPGGYLQTAGVYAPRQISMPQGLADLYQQYNLDRGLRSQYALTEYGAETQAAMQNAAMKNARQQFMTQIYHDAAKYGINKLMGGIGGGMGMGG